MAELEMRTFDTHKYIKELTKTGFNEAQAEVLVKSILESRDYDFSKLATREQLALVEEKLGSKIDTIEKDIASMKQEMGKFATKEQLATMEEKFMGRINALENNLLKWIVPLFFTTWAMIAGIVFKLFSH